MRNTSDVEPLVSVIIPNFNYGKFLEECLNSVFSQTYTKFEVILVDDGSTDNSLEIANKFGAQITLIRQKNNGVNSARNLGIRSSKGDLIALCDSDDFWDSKKLELQVALMKTRQEVGLVYCDHIEIDEIGTTLIRNSAVYRGNIARTFIEKPTQALISCGGSTAIFRRCLLDLNSLFDINLRGNGEDWDFFRRISQVAEVDFVPIPLAFIRKHKESRGARSLEHFYFGNHEAITKTLVDPFYKWDRTLKRRFLFKFEFMLFKSCLYSGKIHNSIRHLFKALFPFRFYKD
jgi:glycosyltransferase involved in cell wall biosynthesis